METYRMYNKTASTTTETVQKATTK